MVVILLLLVVICKSPLNMAGLEIVLARRTMSSKNRSGLARLTSLVARWASKKIRTYLLRYGSTYVWASKNLNGLVKSEVSWPGGLATK